MAESKVISTTTIATSNDKVGNVVIYTFYNRNYFDCSPPEGWTDRPLIKEALLTDTIGYKNGVPFEEGHGLLTVEEYPSSIEFWIDSNGHLFIKGEDADNYSFDENGHLVYNFCL